MNKQYRWASLGDINAYCGLMLDNVAGLLLIVSLLQLNFSFPAEFAIRYMIPGTAIGVLIGDLAFFVLAIMLARKTGSTTVTAMPLGLDTPSTFGMAFLVLGPAFKSALPAGLEKDPAAIQTAAMFAWQVGICSIVASGLLKLVCALGSNWVRQVVPRAGLLGSLAAIALVLISFLPLLRILDQPLVGLVALAIVLTALVGRVPLPFKVPGAVGGLVVAGTIFGLMNWMGFIEGSKVAFEPHKYLFPTEWTTAFSMGWLDAFDESIHYLPVVIPFALATVVGGIDCTESAAAVGDHYNTNTVIGVEAIATLLAGLCGAVIQTTPYIGHPAYKAMGGRAAYTLATALTIGFLGVTGLFGYFYLLIPESTVFPILVFVGLEIAAQSFLATPRRHYPAVAFACVPALAKLVMLLAVQPIDGKVTSLMLLANGFILTSIIWSAAMAMAIDRRLLAAAGFYFTAALFTLVGLMHSPMRDERILSPWAFSFLPESAILPVELWEKHVAFWTLGYATVGVLMVLWHFYLRASGQLTSAFEDAAETSPAGDV